MTIVVIVAIAVLLVALLSVLSVLKVRKKKLDENTENPTYWDEQNAWLVSEFSRCNVVVYGKKGSGKDLTFSHVINLRKERHYSNMPYNKLTTVMGLDSLSVGDNTYEDFIDGTLCKFKPVFDDGLDFYVSDAGVYLPSQYDKELSIRYPSMPLYYALSRQLHKQNIHCNVQAIGRLWKKLREQSDSHIWIRKTVDKGDYFVVHAISYDRYESAERRLLPVKDKQYGATYGDIVERRFRILKSSIDYDTYYFRTLLLDTPVSLYDRKQAKLNLKEILTHGYYNSFEPPRN